VAGWLLLRRHDRLPVVAALVVGLASAVAVVLSVYLRVPRGGPFPELYEPSVPRLDASAVAAAVAAAGAGLLLAVRRRRRVP
jgi:hypothetical protein